MRLNDKSSFLRCMNDVGESKTSLSSLSLVPITWSADYALYLNCTRSKAVTTF